jgi:O-acetyl-ADP-ribose deacetylase (regulator of RNase III)
MDAAERMSVVRGDITKESTDAIVNAANSTLLGGGGVDGAIHRAAGPRLLEECRALGGCRTGEAKITRGYNLSAKWVIHTVGPVWRGGAHGEDALLRSCYQCCLALANAHRLASIGFPCISTGIYGYPPDEACEIAIGEVVSFLELNELPERVVFVCFDSYSFDLYAGSLSRT